MVEAADPSGASADRGHGLPDRRRGGTRGLPGRGGLTRQRQPRSAITLLGAAYQVSLVLSVAYGRGLFSRW